MIDPFDTLQEIGDELGRRATVGTFIVVVGSAEAAALGAPANLTPMMALHRYDRTDREKAETYLRCVKAAMRVEVEAFIMNWGEPPECFKHPPAADSAEES